VVGFRHFAYCISCSCHSHTQVSATEGGGAGRRTPLESSYTRRSPFVWSKCSGVYYRPHHTPSSRSASSRSTTTYPPLYSATLLPVMGLWDSDDDGGWSSEEEHPSPKKVKVVITEDSSPDQVDRSILGNKLERRVSWDKILEKYKYITTQTPSELRSEDGDQRRR